MRKPEDDYERVVATLDAALEGNEALAKRVKELEVVLARLLSITEDMHSEKLTLLGHYCTPGITSCDGDCVDASIIGDAVMEARAVLHPLPKRREGK